MRSESGFTFIFAIISVVIVGITTTTIVSLWSTTVKREKEIELFYRLEKVRSSLREYRKKYNRYPSHLEELLVNKYIRNCYLVDPITNKEWQPVFAPVSEGYGIKDIHSKSEDLAMKFKNGQEVKYVNF